MFLSVILVTHSPITRRRIAAISAANHESGGEDGCYREKFLNFVAWTEPDPKTAFFAFLGYPSTILHTAFRKQFYPKSTVLMESRDSEGVPLLVWRVCDQAFGRYRPLKDDRQTEHLQNNAD